MGGWLTLDHAANRSSTLPLLCSWSRFEVEGVHQVECCLAQILVVECGPQVDHVALLLTGGVEAMEHVGRVIHAERAATSVGAMDRACTALLRPRAAQARRQTEMVKHA